MDYPEPYKWLVDSFSWLNFSFIGNIGLSCSFRFDYVTEVVVTTAVPLALTLCLFIGYLLQLRVGSSLLNKFSRYDAILRNVFFFGTPMDVCELFRQ